MDSNENNETETLPESSPLKHWREVLGLTQEALAHLAGVSVITIVRSEQGMFTQLSPKIVNVLLDRYAGPEDWSYCEEQYTAFQINQRSQHTWRVKNTSTTGLSLWHGVIPPVGVFLNTLHQHPFLWWRLELGFNDRLAFCRAACLPPPQVLRYESGRQRTMPRSIMDALGPYTGDIAIIERLGKEYFDSLTTH